MSWNHPVLHDLGCIGLIRLIAIDSIGSGLAFFLSFFLSSDLDSLARVGVPWLNGMFCFVDSFDSAFFLPFFLRENPAGLVTSPYGRKVALY